MICSDFSQAIPDESCTRNVGRHRPAAALGSARVHLPGDTIYEPFSGSGTTLIAAETIGRVCLAVELDPRYVDMAVRRWQAFTGKQATRLSDRTLFNDA